MEALVKINPSFYKDKTFWETKLKENEILLDVSSIDCLDYNPHQLSQLLVSSLARLSLYDTESLEVIRTYRCNTQYQIYGGSVRKTDGRLLAAGSEEGKIFVFETNNPKPMRVINISTPTHKTIFSGNNLITFSDDWATRLIDIGSGDTIQKYESHKDYVRCGHIIEQLIVSGSYDGTVKVWDPRIEASTPVFEYDHGCSVEALCSRRSKVLISVGGTKMQVFDMTAGKILSNILPKHHKTITSVANYEDEYLLTGGLDGFVNVLNFNYEHITRFNFEDSQVLSMLANPKLVAIGLNDHSVHIKKFDDFIKKSSDEQAELEKLQSGYFGPHMVTRYFHEAIAESQDPVATRRALLALKQKRAPVVMADINSMYESVIVDRGSKPHSSASLSKHERLLLSFKHCKALDSVLRHHQNEPDEVVHILHELMKRDKLKVALAGCQSLPSLMTFIAKNLSGIRHNRILLDTLMVIIDLICNDTSSIQLTNQKIRSCIEELGEAVNKELQVIDACILLRQQTESIISQY